MSYYCHDCGTVIEEDDTDLCPDCKKKKVIPMNPIDQALEAAQKMARFISTWKDCLSGVQISEEDFVAECGLSEYREACALLRTPPAQSIAPLEAQKAEGSSLWSDPGKLTTEAGTFIDAHMLELWPWASMICSAHQIPNPECLTCNPLRRPSSHPATDSGTTVGGDVDAVADFLHSIGWNNPGDAQWSGLKANLSKLGRLALAGAPVQGAVSREAIVKMVDRWWRTPQNNVELERLDLIAEIQALQLPAPVSDEGASRLAQAKSGMMEAVQKALNMADGFIGQYETQIGSGHVTETRKAIHAALASLKGGR